MSAPNADAVRVARNFSALVLASLFSKGLLFVWQIVLGNLFAPYEYGVYNTVTSLMAVSSSVVGLGMGLIMIREVARKPDRIGDYWSAMLTMQTIFSLIAYILILLTAMSSGYEPLILAYTAIGGISLIVDMFGNISFDLLIAQEKMTITALVEVAHIIARISLAGLVLAAGYGLLGIYVVTILTGIGRSIVLNLANVRLGHHPNFPVNRSLALSLLRDGLPLALSGFLSLAYQHADKLMTTAIIGATFTGLLGPAFVINYGMIEVISTTIIVAIYPMLSRSYTDNRAMYSLIVEKLARFMLIVALPLTLTFSIFARPIILTIYRPEYEPTAQILSILIWSTLLMMVGNVFSKALLVQNKQRVSLMIRALCLGVNVALNAYFLHTFRDPRGTALATVIAEGLSLILSASVFRVDGFSWARVLPAMGRVVLLGGVTAGVMLTIGQVNWVVGAIAGLVVYALGILFGRVLSHDDWLFIMRFMSALPLGNRLHVVWARLGIPHQAL